jgi:hypothetical protein
LGPRVHAGLPLGKSSERPIPARRDVQLPAW